MQPTRLGNGFWIIHAYDQILDAAYTQFCINSPLKDSRDECYKQTAFARYLVLAYRTPQVYPQIVHFSFRDNMRLIIEGTAIPAEHILDMSHAGKAPIIHTMDISYDLMANAVIYTANKNYEYDEFIQWGFLQPIHRNVAVETLTHLGYELADAMTNLELDSALFAQGHYGCVVGTTCLTGMYSGLQQVAMELDPTLRDTFSDFPKFIKRLNYTLSKVQAESKSFIVEKHSGYNYRTSIEAQEESNHVLSSVPERKGYSRISGFELKSHPLRTDIPTRAFGLQ